MDPHLTEVFLEDPQKYKNKIVRALIIIWLQIKREEAHIMVSKYVFPYSMLGSGPRQSALTLLKDYAKENTYRSGATRML